MQASGRISKEELAILNPLKKYLPESTFNDPVFIPPTSKPDKVDRKNRRKATKLFKDAGWNLVDGKLKNKKGDIFSWGSAKAINYDYGKMYFAYFNEILISGVFFPVSYTHLTLPTNREV